MCDISRDVPDTTLPDLPGFNQIVIYRIPESTGSKFKHNNQRMKWEYYCQLVKPVNMI